MKYKNLSFAKRTIQGVTFNPGEIQDVPNFINDPKFVLIDSNSIEESNKIGKSDSTKSSKKSNLKSKQGGNDSGGDNN